MAAQDTTASLEVLLREQAKIARAMLAPLTRQGYANDWRAFCHFCEAEGLAALPATSQTVCLFVVHKLSQGRKVSSVRRLVAGILHRHRSEGQPAEWLGDVEELLVGARRLVPQSLKQATPLRIEDVRAIARRLARIGTAKAIRDRAIIVAGFASALRSASLVDLDVEDLAFTRQGAILHIRREKNDQLARGRYVGLPMGKHRDTCPVRALRDWLRRRKLGDSGPLFCHVLHNRPRLRRLGAERIGLLLKQALRAIGRNDVRGYSGHSLRSGLITAAAESDVAPLKVAMHSGHRTLAMVQRYFRRSDVFRANLLSSLDI